MNNIKKNINVDLLKESYNSIGFVTRQGENGQTMTVRVTENGINIPLDTTHKVKLKGVTPDNKYIALDGTIVSTKGNITITKDWNSTSGDFKVAYIEVIKGSEILTSINLDWQVLPEATLSDGDTAHYVNELQQVIDDLQTKADKALDDLNKQLAQANKDITKINADIVNINKDIASALEQFKSGDFYTKAESDSRFAKKSDVPTLPNASLTQKGIVQLYTGATSTDETKAVTPKALYDLRETVDRNYILKDSPTTVNVTSKLNFLTNNTPPTINGSPILSSKTYSCTTWQTLTPETQYEAKEGTTIAYRVITLDGKMKVEFKGALGRKDGANMSGGGNLVKFPDSLATKYKIRRTTATNVSNIPCQLMILDTGAVYVHTNIAGTGVTLVSFDGFSYWLD